MFLQSEEVGPLTDEQFLKAIRSETIAGDIEVRSPEVTRGEWIAAARIVLPAIQERIEQKLAEQRRLERNQERRRENDVQNMQTLRRGVARAISDGRVTLQEREQLTEFARKARIPQSAVDALVREQSSSLLDLRIDEAIEDGILEPHERQQITNLARDMGLAISLTREQSRRLSACEFAWKIATASYQPEEVNTEDVSLISNETPLARARVEWFEIVQQKKPTGIRLDELHSLKLVGIGDCLLTDKRLVLVGEFSAKKTTLSAIAQVRRYRDGVFCNRSNGKSIFLRPHSQNIEWDCFAILLENCITLQPVLGTEPKYNFIPDQGLTFSDVAAPFTTEQPFADAEEEPRYTFRVVGDHIGDRAFWIDDVRIGDPIRIQREPQNVHDCNAIAVYDLHDRQLGYLKREVASWFAPMLDRGSRYRSQAYRKPTSGGLIVGMFE